jgi:hypothetical protein
MELADFKSDFKNAESGYFSKENIKQFMLVNKHPALKGIKIQMILESTFWAVFLAVYYNFFDGHLKSPLWNVLLVLSVVLILVHNVLAYQITSIPINGENILDSMKKYLDRINTYSRISIGTRMVAIALILGYFISTISFTPEKYWSFGIVLLIFPVQFYLLQKVWAKRITKINTVYQNLKE